MPRAKRKTATKSGSDDAESAAKAKTKTQRRSTRASKANAAGAGAGATPAAAKKATAKASKAAASTAKKTTAKKTAAKKTAAKPKAEAAAAASPKLKRSSTAGSYVGNPDWELWTPECHTEGDDIMSTVHPTKAGDFKMISWNVNGLKAFKKNCHYMEEYLKKEAPHVVCLNETKLNEGGTAMYESMFPGYTCHWACCKIKKGYSGVAIMVADGVKVEGVTEGIGIKEHDQEGRVLTLELPKLYVVASYIPNSGMKLDRLKYRTESWDPAFREYLKGLAAKKGVVWCGDLNVAHEEIDLHSPKTNRNKTPGFCDGERENFTAVLDAGFVDTFREQRKMVQAFSYWSYRFQAKLKNKGWRLDYFVASNNLALAVTDTFIRQDCIGSDHVPIGLCLKESAVL